MPAITVDDTTVLPRIPVPALADRPRRVVQRIDAPSGYEGEGFPVRRAFAEPPSEATPASLIRSKNGETVVILDPAAAQELEI